MSNEIPQHIKNFINDLINSNRRGYMLTYLQFNELYRQNIVDVEFRKITGICTYYYAYPGEEINYRNFILSWRDRKIQIDPQTEIMTEFLNYVINYK